MNKAHADLSPSGADRWMVCAGSVAMEASQPGDSSEYADEGTTAHEVAKWCLMQDKDAAAFQGRRIEIVNGVYYAGTGELPPLLKDHRTPIRRMFEVEEEMVDGVQIYVNTAKALARNGESLIEQRVPIGHLTGEEGATGTSDQIVLAIDDDELIVHDFKYGRGVRVYAKKNRQAMHYALGALEEHELAADWKCVRIVISQPRLQHLDEWTCSVEELKAFAEEVRVASARVREAQLSFGNTKMDWGAAYLVAEDKACQFCKAKAECPELARRVAEGVGADFKVLAELSASKPNAAAFIEAKLETVTDLSVLAEKMNATDLIEDWCKAVRGRVDLELNNGNAVPGWKLVEGRKGNRSWLDPVKVEGLLKKMRYKMVQMYKMHIIGVPDAQKLLAKKPKQWAELEKMITQTPGKASVARDTDKRPALAAAGDSFTDLDDIA